MAKFYIPNPASALPKPRVIAPKQPSLIAAGVSAFNTGLGEVADAFRARERNRKELNAAADLVEADDPNQAQVYRNMANELDAYVPLAGNPEQARAASRASGAVSSGILSDIIQTQNRMRLEKLEQQNALERIGVEFGNRLQYLEAATAADRNLKEFGMGLEKEIIKFREGAQNESEVRNMAFDFGPRAVDAGANPEKVGNILNSMRDGAVTPEQAYSQMLAEVPSIQARAETEVAAKASEIGAIAEAVKKTGATTGYGFTFVDPNKAAQMPPEQREMIDRAGAVWASAYSELDKAEASLAAAEAAYNSNPDSPETQSYYLAAKAKYDAAQRSVSRADEMLRRSGGESPFGNQSPDPTLFTPGNDGGTAPDSPGASLDKAMMDLERLK